MPANLVASVRLCVRTRASARVVRRDVLASGRYGFRAGEARRPGAPTGRPSTTRSPLPDRQPARTSCPPFAPPLWSPSFTDRPPPPSCPPTRPLDSSPRSRPSSSPACRSSRSSGRSRACPPAPPLIQLFPVALRPPWRSVESASRLHAHVCAGRPLPRVRQHVQQADARLPPSPFPRPRRRQPKGPLLHQPRPVRRRAAHDVGAGARDRPRLDAGRKGASAGRWEDAAGRSPAEPEQLLLRPRRLHWQLAARSPASP